MNAQTITPANEVSFKDFLFKNKRNKTILILAGVAIVVQFAVFKYFYPFASFINGDSYVYLDTAFRNLDINNYMVGYSRFLRLISVFTKSDTALVAIQYFLIQFSSLLLLFTFFYFYQLGKIIKTILICFIVINPLFLYMANYVSSDAYFLALSLIWFTLLLWIIHEPSFRVILLHTLVIYIAFTVRNNALIYPLLAAFAFSISPLKLKMKLAGIFVSLVLIGSFIVYTSYKFQALTGTFQYSPFSGWQLANNALYAYRYLDPKEKKPVPLKFKELDNAVNKYFDTTRDIIKNPQEAMLASTVYMWYEKSPLHIYMNRQFNKDSTADNRKRWATMGPLYSKYGIYLIKQYPLLFAKYFLWPNSTKYYALPIEFLENYNMGRDTVALIAKVWFGYKTQKVNTRLNDFNVTLLNFYPFLSGAINLVFIFSFLCILFLRNNQGNPFFRKGLRLAIIIWIVNAGFTIFASSAALRFQAFPLIIFFCFDLLMLNHIAQVAATNTKSNDSKYQISPAS